MQLLQVTALLHCDTHAINTPHYQTAMQYALRSSLCANNALHNRTAYLDMHIMHNIYNEHIEQISR
jgi:hypothetical protein